MTTIPTQWVRDALKRVRGRGDEIADDLRTRVIEPIGDGLRTGADAATSRVKRSGGESKLNAPVIALAGIAGAVGEFFLDPQSGRSRRAAAQQRVGAFLRRRKARAARQARYAAGAVKGAAYEAKPGGSEARELNDPALESKVESEIFRGQDAPRDKVNVSVEEGIVYLRGELDSADRIEELTASARAVEGVRGVENLLHLPGEEAPAKADGHGRGGPKRATAARSA